MPRRAILHIGPMKTGSTSIQLWLHRSADMLATHGCHFPVSLGSRNMSRLTYMAQALAFNGALSSGDDARLDALRAELAGLPSAIHTVIFSGEMLGQVLNEAAEVRALKTMLDEFFDDYLVVLYLRRQDELSLSRYNTSLRRGERRARPFATPFDYELRLNLWLEAFGREAIRPRLFERGLMAGGDVVRDFAHTVGLPYQQDDGRPLDRNPSLRPEAQLFLARFAEAVRDSGFEAPFVDIAAYDEINRILNREFHGPGAKPLRVEAVAFYDQVRASNERVRAEWFPDRETLFAEDFSAYPELADRPPPAKRLLDVAMAVLTSLVTTPRSANIAGAPAREREDRAPRAQIRREKRDRRGDGGRKRRAASKPTL